MRRFDTALLGLALLTAGCTGSGVNTAPNVFQAQQGTIQLTVATDDPTIQSVEFQVNGTPVGTDSDASDGWGIEWDTSSVQDGINYVKAVGTTAEGTQVELLNNTLLIDNSGTVTGGTTGGTGTTGTDTTGTDTTGTDTTNTSGTGTAGEF